MNTSVSKFFRCRWACELCATNALPKGCGVRTHIINREQNECSVCCTACPSPECEPGACWDIMKDTWNLVVYELLMCTTTLLLRSKEVFHWGEHKSCTYDPRYIWITLQYLVNKNSHVWTIPKMSSPWAHPAKSCKQVNSYRYSNVANHIALATLLD